MIFVSKINLVFIFVMEINLLQSHPFNSIMLSVHFDCFLCDVYLIFQLFMIIYCVLIMSYVGCNFYLPYFQLWNVQKPSYIDCAPLVEASALSHYYWALFNHQFLLSILVFYFIEIIALHVTHVYVIFICILYERLFLFSLL